MTAQQPATAQQVRRAVCRIEPYTLEHCSAVAAFNRRIKPAGLPFRLPDTPTPDWLPRIGDEKLYQEVFLAVEDGDVRGAYTIKHQEFAIGERIHEVALYRTPVTEAVVNSRYSAVTAQLIREAARTQPLPFAMSAGGFDETFMSMIQTMGWRMWEIPFYFKVLNGFQFLRNTRYLRTSRLRRLLCNAVAYSGIGWMAARSLDSLLTARDSTSDIECTEGFGAWADDLWHASRKDYSMAAVRDSAVLNLLYPANDPRFIRIKVTRRERILGWAVLLNSKMHNSPQFGNLRVGSIVDCLAGARDAAAVIRAATDYLTGRHVDLMISNQSHRAWREALRRAGFLPGPSEFYFVPSRQLTRLLNDVDPSSGGFHLNRGDGEGPTGL